MEWVPIYETLSDLELNDPELHEAFLNRIDKFRRDEKYGEEMSDDDIWQKESQFTAELCKIICISFGYFDEQGSKKITSVYDDDEKELLEKAKKILINAYNNNYVLCGYAIKRWDLPWLAKRMVINQIKLPTIIDFGKKKPWEINVIDLPEIWSMGCLQEKYTPFEMLCVSMKIPTPKNDIGGADVKRVYYQEGDLERIVTYCEKDVETTMDLERKLSEFINI